MLAPKISIIIPVYNVEKYIHQCIDSVVNQTYKNLEIILVDDGSPDNSPQICDDYSKKDDRIKVIHKQNGGLSSARNKGIEVSSGDYIMFVDSDDWINKETCEIAINIINEYKVDVVMWPYIREYEDKSEKKEIFDKQLIVYNEEDVKKKLHRRMLGLLDNELAYPENADAIVTACMKLYKTKLIKEDKLKFIDTKLIGTEDALFNLYVFGNVKKVVYINQYLYHYRRDNMDSLTTLYKPNLKEQWDYLFDLMEKYIEENNLDKEYVQALNNRITMSIIGLGLVELNSDKSIFLKIKKIKDILSDPRYRKVSKTLTLKYFPIHWKIFFLCAKKNSIIGIYLMLLAIKILR